LTAGGHHLWRVQELNLLADWVHWVAVAAHTLDGEKNDSHAVRKAYGGWWRLLRHSTFPVEVATWLTTHVASTAAERRYVDGARWWLIS